eukprot:1160224-Pelagomonas_calceolata.AAC.12
MSLYSLVFAQDPGPSACMFQSGLHSWQQRGRTSSCFPIKHCSGKIPNQNLNLARLAGLGQAMCVLGPACMYGRLGH